ncbi:hypothetical protein [Eggerthella sp. YY7918]|uniref:hypothetical protein n=1 Tax=Eggerthella sp. (strain YY7918) TaxID=502558 RepID=UPI0002171227|nr:hypothetical protein [Eggerthella sp. YY7918]BAK45808.1 hypothetical protein EGYY_28300 [Eggerthella sp. YY7918]
MAMETTAIRFAPEERAWIQSYADFQGKMFSGVMTEHINLKLRKVRYESYSY